MAGKSNGGLPANYLASGMVFGPRRFEGMGSTWAQTAPIVRKRLNPSDWALLILSLIALPSAVFHGALGFDERIAFAFFAPIIAFLAVFWKNIRIDAALGTVVFSVLILGALATQLSGTNSQILMGATLAIAIPCGKQVYRTLISRSALYWATIYSLILIAGAIAGMVYAASGGPSLLKIQIGYRETDLFLSTFSLSSVGGFIRPSGVFDEPGAFAMFIALITFFNDVSRQNTRLNQILVFSMVLTGSLAGVFVAVLYLVFSEGAKPWRKKIWVALPVVMGGFLLMQLFWPANPVVSVVNSFYGDRVQIVDGRFNGDNRSDQIAEFFEVVDEEILLKGAKAADSGYVARDISSNPFSIVYGYGVVISIAYFALLLWLFANPLSRRGVSMYASLGLLFLLLQRPYLYHMSWSVLIIATVYLIYHSPAIKKNRVSAV